MAFKYFSQSDFSSANPSCSIDDMDKDFIDLLDAGRQIAGIPFVINSGYRTVEHELEQGRDGKSSHTKGLAVDIKAEGSRQRYLIIDALMKVGFTRIGVDDEFVHVDGDTEKDQQVIWTY